MIQDWLFAATVATTTVALLLLVIGLVWWCVGNTYALIPVGVMVIAIVAFGIKVKGEA